jgi:glutaminyl-peptide cyclotransferase
MKVYNPLFLMALGVILHSCGSDSNESENNYSLKVEENKKEFKLGESLQAQVNGEKDSVIYFLGEQRLAKTVGGESLNHTFDGEKLGKWQLNARIYNNGEVVEKQQEITLFNDAAPVTYTYEIINKYPHQADAYTQGLEFFENKLYESTGHYGSSSLRLVDLTTGEVQRKIDIPTQYFAEGITILNNKIYQLTWKEGVGFIYDVETFEKTGEFNYEKSKEGWGLANDGSILYKSDGTEKIWFLDPASPSLPETDYIQTVTNRTIATQLNELEWVDGKIYANTYQKDGVAIINPKNGAIEGVINFSGLRDQLGNTADLDPVNDVLNGIAYDPESKKLYVTGKDWDTLFEVKIIEN